MGLGPSGENLDICIELIALRRAKFGTSENHSVASLNSLLQDGHFNLLLLGRCNT